MSASDEPRMLEPGEVFETRYRIEGILGVGGVATVYRAFDLKREDHVALKIIPHSGGSTPEAFTRAQREGNLLLHLSHPHLVKVYDTGITADAKHAFVVMEVVSGKNLREVLHALGRLTEVEAVRLLIRVVQALIVAHRANVIHRDIKPENTMLLHENLVKVLDFGIAKFIGYGYQSTAPQNPFGTLLYMAPEQFLAARIGPACDVFALGVVAFELLVGKHYLFLKEDGLMLEQVYWGQIKTCIPPLVCELRPEVSLELSRVIAKMMHKDPGRRQQSMEELLGELLPIERKLRTRLERDLLGLTLANELAKEQSNATPNRPPAVFELDATAPHSEHEFQRFGPRGTVRLNIEEMHHRRPPDEFEKNAPQPPPPSDEPEDTGLSPLSQISIASPAKKVVRDSSTTVTPQSALSSLSPNPTQPVPTQPVPIPALSQPVPSQPVPSQSAPPSQGTTEATLPVPPSPTREHDRSSIERPWNARHLAMGAGMLVLGLALSVPIYLNLSGAGANETSPSAVLISSTVSRAVPAPPSSHQEAALRSAPPYPPKGAPSQSAPSEAPPTPEPPPTAKPSTPAPTSRQAARRAPPSSPEPAETQSVIDQAGPLFSSAYGPQDKPPTIPRAPVVRPKGDGSTQDSSEHRSVLPFPRRERESSDP